MKDGERGVEGDELDDCSSSGLLCLGVWNSLLGLFGDTGTLMVVPTTLSTLPAEALVLAVCIEGDGEASLDAIVDFVNFGKILRTIRYYGLSCEKSMGRHALHLLAY